MTVSFDNVGHAFEQTNGSAGDHSWQAAAAMDAYPIGKSNASTKEVKVGEPVAKEGAAVSKDVKAGEALAKDAAPLTPGEKAAKYGASITKPEKTDGSTKDEKVDEPVAKAGAAVSKDVKVGEAAAKDAAPLTPAERAAEGAAKVGASATKAEKAGQDLAEKGTSDTVPKPGPDDHHVGTTKPEISVQHGVAIKDVPGTAGKAVAPEGRQVGTVHPEIPVQQGVAIKDEPGTAGKEVAPFGRHLGTTKPEAPADHPKGITKVESGGGQPPTGSKDGNGVVPKSEAPDGQATSTETERKAVQAVARPAVVDQLRLGF